jgi:hypothetical protein
MADRVKARIKSAPKPFTVEFLEAYDKRHVTRYAEDLKTAITDLASTTISLNGTASAKQQVALQPYKDVFKGTQSQSNLPADQKVAVDAATSLNPGLPSSAKVEENQTPRRCEGRLVRQTDD